MLSKTLIDDFYAGRRGVQLHFCVNDEVSVKNGVYAGRVGETVVLDITHGEPTYLVDFGDGTDEVVIQSNLETVSESTMQRVGADQVRLQCPR